MDYIYILKTTSIEVGRFSRTADKGKKAVSTLVPTTSRALGTAYRVASGGISKVSTKASTIYTDIAAAIKIAFKASVRNIKTKIMNKSREMVNRLASLQRKVANAAARKLEKIAEDIKNIEITLPRIGPELSPAGFGRIGSSTSIRIGDKIDNMMAIVGEKRGHWWRG